MLTFIQKAIQSLTGDLFPVDTWLINSTRNCGCSFSFLPHRKESVVISAQSQQEVEAMAHALWLQGFRSDYPLHFTQVTGLWSERMVFEPCSLLA